MALVAFHLPEIRRYGRAGAASDAIGLVVFDSFGHRKFLRLNEIWATRVF